MFVPRFFMPHGLTIDHEGNMWLTDVAMHQVCTQSSAALGSITSRCSGNEPALTPSSGGGKPDPRERRKSSLLWRVMQVFIPSWSVLQNVVCERNILKCIYRTQHAWKTRTCFKVVVFTRLWHECKKEPTRLSLKRRSKAGFRYCEAELTSTGALKSSFRRL